MSWKSLRTDIWRMVRGKKKMPRPLHPGRKPDNEPVPAVVSISEAVESIPEELLKDLKNYDSIKSQNSKLSREQQLELMEFIARYASSEEINEYFMQKYKMTISQPLVYQYKRTPKWRPIIKKLREKYLLDVKEAPMAHKKVRLDRAERIYHKSMIGGQYGTAMGAVRHSMEEVESKHQGDTSMVFNQYNIMSDQEIQEKKAELLERIKNAGSITVKGVTNEITKD